MVQSEMTMTGLNLVPAQWFSMAQLASLVSRAYADYYYRVSVTQPQFEQICLETDADLAQSVVALLGKEMVGIALLSRRDPRGWISTVGVLPAFRRRGIARAMLLHLQHRARMLGLRQVTLEVLAENQPGLVLYGELGFDRVRDLALLILEPNTFVSDATRLPPVTQAIPVALLANFDAFHIVTPSWQRELASLRHRLDYMTGLSYMEDGSMIGYILFQTLLSYHVVHDLAVLPSTVQPLVVAEHLLRAVHQRSPACGGYVVNAAVDDPLLPAYHSLGYRSDHRQYELIWELEQ